MKAEELKTTLVVIYIIIASIFCIGIAFSSLSSILSLAIILAVTASSHLIQYIAFPDGWL